MSATKKIDEHSAKDSSRGSSARNSTCLEETNVSFLPNSFAHFFFLSRHIDGERFTKKKLTRKGSASCTRSMPHVSRKAV